MHAHYFKYLLNFKLPSGTSRGILTQKETFFLILKHQGKIGIGECAVFRGLSIDDLPDYEEKLKWVCSHIHLGKDILLEHLKTFPSLFFGVEQAFLSLNNKETFLFFPSLFVEGKAKIPINGLIWMGKPEYMYAQIQQKIAKGYTTIKLKIGALDFETELMLIKKLRNEFNSNEITLRVDANGAFSPAESLEKIKRLSDFDIHSIEQPIKAGQWSEMAELCRKTPIDIALDEDLIGVFNDNKQKLLNYIRPQYIILKPSLHGGFRGCDEWIDLSEKTKTKWWITSALESNIGLNAISQYTYSLPFELPQGLGTGGLFTNNFESPLRVESGFLTYDIDKKWNLGDEVNWTNLIPEY